jgi:hypothetical protein
MNRFALPLILLFVFTAASVYGAPISGGMRPPTQEEKNFFTNVVLPAMMTVKKAMPPAPQGWIVESETPIAPVLPDLVSDNATRLWFNYAISYKRAADIEGERKKLDDALAEARTNFEGAAKSRANELTKKRAAAEEALKRAAKKQNHSEEKRLKKEIEEINGKLRAISEETERAILAETDEYLVRDTSFTLRFTVNATTAAFPDARYFSRPRAAYALKKEGGRVGPTGWKQDQVMLLYGDWADAGKDTFRGKVEQRPFSSRVRTIAIMIEIDSLRLDQVLKQMGMQDILGMLR